MTEPRSQEKTAFDRFIESYPYGHIFDLDRARRAFDHLTESDQQAAIRSLPGLCAALDHFGAKPLSPADWLSRAGWLAIKFCERGSDECVEAVSANGDASDGDSILAKAGRCVQSRRLENKSHNAVGLVDDNPVAEDFRRVSCHCSAHSLGLVEFVIGQDSSPSVGVATPMVTESVWDGLSAHAGSAHILAAGRAS